MNSNLPNTVWFKREAFVLTVITLVCAIISAVGTIAGFVASLLFG